MVFACVVAIRDRNINDKNKYFNTIQFCSSKCLLDIMNNIITVMKYITLCVKIYTNKYNQVKFFQYL